VKRRRAGGVLFAGDGVNDAPTLAAAGASVSFGDAPHLSRHASDFVILGPDLSAVTEARRIARRARRLLVQNVGWALAYNALSIPLAAAGLVSPWIAAAGMSASSLLVVGNAMRLARPRRDETSVSGARAVPVSGAPI
jgi:Cu2+-exporting ATPase